LFAKALVEGSSACNSGILPGDCLVEVNGKNVYCKGIELATKVHPVMHMSSAMYAVAVFCCPGPFALRDAWKL
jgi:hypothetical protein